MKILNLLILSSARFFTSAVFLAGAVKNILNWHETEKNLMSVMADWQAHVDFSQEAQIFFSVIIPWTSLFLLIATVLMLVGGLLLLLGIRERLGVSLLIIFLIPATLLFHPFWWIDGVAYELQTVMFLKNLAILGCLIQILFQNNHASSSREQEERESFSSLRF